MVQPLLDSARRRRGVKPAVDRGEIADRVLALQRSGFKKARIGASVSVPKDVPAVAGDPQELQQVLLNAVVNARQSIETGGWPGPIVLAAPAPCPRAVVPVGATVAGVSAGYL